MGPGFESLKVHQKKRNLYGCVFLWSLPFQGLQRTRRVRPTRGERLARKGLSTKRRTRRSRRSSPVPSFHPAGCLFLWSFMDKNADLKTSIDLSLSCPCSNDTADPAARGRLYHASFGIRTTIVQQQSKSLCRYAFYLFQFGNFDLHIRIGIAAARVEITELLVRKAALILARNGEFP